MESDSERSERVKGMTPEEKLNEAARLYWAAREAKAVELRQAYPDWSEEKIQQQVRYIFITEQYDLPLAAIR